MYLIAAKQQNFPPLLMARIGRSSKTLWNSRANIWDSLCWAHETENKIYLPRSKGDSLSTSIRVFIKPLIGEPLCLAQECFVPSSFTNHSRSYYSWVLSHKLYFTFLPVMQIIKAEITSTLGPLFHWMQLVIPEALENADFCLQLSSTMPSRRLNSLRWTFSNLSLICKIKIFLYKNNHFDSFFMIQSNKETISQYYFLTPKIQFWKYLFLQIEYKCKVPFSIMTITVLSISSLSWLLRLFAYLQ